MDRIILAIETSCDETSAAIIKNGKIISNIISSQKIHSEYGGVIPEMASREHIKNISSIVKLSLSKAKIKKEKLNAIAYTKGPGLLGALMIGVSFAKGLAYALNIPTIAVNHIKAHIISNFIENENIKLPLLALIVSGGHTEIVILNKENKNFKTKVIGQTQDDALGEAFDKIAKILRIKYPGGPIVDKLAQKGNPNAFKFPDTNVKDLNMSFSGIKTAFMYFIKEKIKLNSKFIEDNLNDICASIQRKLIEMIINKLEKAIKTQRVNNIAICGGVAANSFLRKEMIRLQKKLDLNVYIPKFEYCTDNAAMIAKLADFKFQNQEFSNIKDIPNPRLKL
ncbi:MAG: tRNA (adenosine(37)-N6)-threonylcarbamoyltransferase complex transferase subunit TsaD [Bacteroidetes bacterium]|nr:tRNA (adenosine(37)-N6)-threonylcarbamoyltransferase complex transferase subunit TsaD [Bacteroidota bacterium]